MIYNDINESNYTLINGIYVTTPNPGYFIKEKDKEKVKELLFSFINFI